jgi:hypothetical protein
LLLALLGCQQAAEKPGPKMEPVGPPLFEDRTDASEVRLAYRNGEEAGHHAILESLGGGVALFDHDGDGLLDLFIPGGGTFDRTAAEHQKDPKREPKILGLPGKLYRNLGGWKFQDVTAAVMPEQALFYSHGAAVADFDRDGWPDLLVTGWGRVALYHNRPADARDRDKGRRLVEVTDQAGLGGVTWATSAAWADLDGDGFPDLYVCQYVDWSFRNNPKCNGYTLGIDRDVCPPRQFQGLADLLFRNKGDGTFEEVSRRAGLRAAGDKGADGQPVELGKGLGVVAADLNGDRRPDLYVANDTVDNFLYVNRGKWKFDEIGLACGAARDDNGSPNGSMGVDVGDYDRSGLPSLFVTNYENEMHALYRNLGKDELFQFSTPAAGIAALGQGYVGWGTAFLDLDNDGWEDLVIVNGHVIRHPKGAGLRQAPVLLRNIGGKFRPITAQGGPYFQGRHIARGLAVGDLDNDGRPDVVISHVNEPVVLLRNVAGEGGTRAHWLGLELAGKKGRDLVGTRVTVEAGGQKLTRFVKSGCSYASAHDARHLFGLGQGERIDRVTVEWAWGQTQTWEGAALAAGRYWRLVEGEKAPQQWRGRAAGR